MFIREPMRISILEVNIECVFEWKMHNLMTVLTDTAAKASKQPTISVVICSRSLNRSPILCRFFRSIVSVLYRTHTWTPHNMPTEWKGGPDGRRHMGLGVVEGTLVEAERKRKREKGTMNERDQLERKRKQERCTVERKAKRQFKSGCMS